MKIIGLARLGRDAELRYLPSGECVANLALAYNYGKKGGDGKKPTQWLDASLWGKRAESLEEYLVQGQQFLVEVRDVHIETYQKGDGGTGTKLVGTIDDLEFAGPPPQSQGNTQQRQAPQRQQAPAQPQRQAPQQRQQAPARQQAAPMNDGFDDSDVPF